MQTMIDVIIESSRLKCPDIVEVKELLGTDGKWRSAWGFPIGVSAVKPYQVRIAGYAYRSNEGSTYGQLAASEDELRNRFNDSLIRRESGFRAELDAMTPEQIKTQYNYWVKSDAITI